jgi:iron-sulfur cluster assembly protein
MSATVTISDNAANKIKQMMTSENKEDQGLRVKVVGGGCSGLHYKLDFDDPKPGDRIFENAGAKVIVDTKSLLYLTGTELEYKETLMQSGFVFQNPNVKRTCGCGSSFAI